MVDMDISKLKKKEKIAVSLYLDKDNLDWLKEDINKYGDGISLSAVFDMILADFRTGMEQYRKEEAEKSQNKKEEKEDGDKTKKD